MTSLDFNDEEILAYYITLLKSLAMRLDADTVQFFFLQRPDVSFPLYIEATKFFSHRDQMVRATVRTISLQVFPIEDMAVRRFVLQHASDVYFGQLAQYLRDLWVQFGASMVAAAASDDPEKGLEKARRDNDVQQDFLLYLSDIFDLAIDELNEVLTEKLLSIAVVPVLLTGSVAGQPLGVSVPENVFAKVQLFLIRQVFDTLHCRTMLEPLASALFVPSFPIRLARWLPSPPPSMGRKQVESNPYRVKFLQFFECADGKSLLLGAAVIHSCLHNRSALSLDYLESIKLLPRRPAVTAAGPQMGWLLSYIFSPLGACRPGGMSQEACTVDNLEMCEANMDHEQASTDFLHLVFKALVRHADWRLDTLKVLCKVLLEWFSESSVQQDPDCQAVATEYLHISIREASQVVKELIEQGDSEGQILDIIFEEWETQLDPHLTLARA
jgi:hypothetical protein